MLKVGCTINEVLHSIYGFYGVIVSCNFCFLMCCLYVLYITILWHMVFLKAYIDDTIKNAIKSW